MRPALIFILLMAGVIVAGTRNVCAQATGMTVRVARPGEGETLYIGPDAPFAHVPVTGWVSADDFAVTQLQLRLEILNGGKSYGNLATTPQPDGMFTFDVAINTNSPWSHPTTECQGSVCHNNVSIGFPPGAVLLRVIATDPLGRKSTAERSVIVDHSGYVRVPVQVVTADDQEQAGAGLRVVAATRLYEWRLRRYDVKTDANGRVLLEVEALGQAPTHYVFQVEPAVVDGVRYTSRESVQLTVPPGATDAGPITLRVASERGQITGSLDSKGQDASNLTVRAIAFPSGATYAAKASLGRFSLTDLPIGKYLLAVDGAQAAPQTVDLSASPLVSLTLPVPAPARSVQGLVHDGDGKPLPFAWVATDNGASVGRVSSSSGEFVLSDIPSGTRALWITAPGYWCRPVAWANRLDIRLTRLPDTRLIPWGPGAITLPAQTLAEVGSDHLSLVRGWVWGEGSGRFLLNTPDLDIALQSGSFALEYLPGETNRFYLAMGQAQVAVSNRDEPITLNAGQMLAFGKGVTRPVPVQLDSAAVQALYAGEAIPVRVESDPAFPSRVRDAVEQLGISFGQATIAVVLGVVLLAAGSILWWMRRREQPLQ